ncbi:MAG: DUF3253 domain-containing protein [Planctomycetota bacterium]
MADDLETQLERAIVALLSERGEERSICPSEAARRVRPDDWRPLMNATRSVAKRLASKGVLIATQRGEPVDIECVKGPIRLSLTREKIGAATDADERG